MPSDLTSYYVYELGGTKRFVEVPVFTNILLFDELNRTHPLVKLGPSHRGSIFLYRIPKVFTLMDNRDYVIADDVKK